MAKFLPTGWSMSKEGTARFNALFPRICAIIKKRARKYTLTAIGPDDLFQEGLLAAAYAVDSYQESRGNIDGYISTVVTNALAMVAAEALAQCRQPYKQVQDADGTWRKVPVHHVELEHDSALDETMGELFEARDAARQVVARLQKARGAIEALGLSEDAQTIHKLRMNTPPELLILARNLNNGRHRLDATSIARYLGWADVRYARAARELRQKFRYMLGVDDVTFTPVPTPAAPPELFTGGKRREVGR